jgi:hypothetical protein
MLAYSNWIPFLELVMRLPVQIERIAVRMNHKNAEAANAIKAEKKSQTISVATRVVSSQAGGQNTAAMLAQNVPWMPP